MIKQRLLHANATDVCNNLGGHLGTIHSRKEENFIRNLTGPTFFYIGLHRSHDEAPFGWEDGTSLDYTNWADGFPKQKVGPLLENQLFIGSLWLRRLS